MRTSNSRTIMSFGRLFAVKSWPSYPNLQAAPFFSIGHRGSRSDPFKTRVSLVARRLQSTSTTTSATGEIIQSIQPIPNGTGNYATVTISNHTRLNSLNSRLIAQLTQTMHTLAKDSTLRLTILRGSTPEVLSDSSSTTTTTPPTTLKKHVASFSSGADIYEMSRLATSEEARVFISKLSGLCESIRRHTTVTVAAIDGLCFGGALEVAACADWRYATRTSTFGMPETKHGIPSVIHARLLANIVGWQRCRELVYLARVYDADTMFSWGLVDVLADDASALQVEISALVRETATLGPQALREQKALVTAWEDLDFRQGIDAGVDAFANMWRDGGSEPKAFMKHFTERKKNAKA
ncbi:hypothetical protein PV10_00873 [Exophiala mesophila]|uniref:Enoyl-CoA hydratase n=1 Tax=Exophiala mesophila TaxID=212818 RepID=A0A0D2ADY5_EXOME|nr:uncharacterized protein PV10_00873 [Exophiala mesophila]KIV97078.1 hypothetical protein PV10_00873 [Exophiala mesophila]